MREGSRISFPFPFCVVVVWCEVRRVGALLKSGAEGGLLLFYSLVLC